MKDADRILKRLKKRGLDEHVRKVAGVYRVSLLALVGTGTARPLGEARARLWGLLRHCAGLSYPAIGKLVEREPATVRWQILQYCPSMTDNRVALWQIQVRHQRERRLRVRSLVHNLKAQNRGLPLQQ